MSRDEVIEAIRAAFTGVAAPPPEEIAHCAQCRDVWLERFPSLPPTWADIEAADIEYEHEALTAVTPSAWRFLLPAYLTWHVQNFDRHTSSNTVDFLIYQLTRTEKTDLYILECYQILSGEQVRAVAKFLRFIGNQSYDSILAEDAQKALSSYWAARAAA
jgi:hypothetical protein